MASRKEIKDFKVDRKTKTVTVYADSLSEEAEKKVRQYKDMADYKIVMLDRKKPNPRPNQRIGKKEMRIYLKDNIDKNIYNELIKKFDRKEKFCEIRSWLKEKLQEQAKKEKKKYIPANTIIQVAMQNEKITTKQNVEEYKKDNLVITTTEEQEEPEE